MKPEIESIYRELEHAIHSLRSFKSFTDWFSDGPLWTNDAIIAMSMEFPGNYSVQKPNLEDLENQAQTLRTLIWNAISVQAIAFINSCTDTELVEIKKRADESGIGEFVEHIIRGDIRYASFL